MKNLGICRGGILRVGWPSHQAKSKAPHAKTAYGAPGPQCYDSAVQDLLQQIDLGLRANLYYLSLMSALSVPDMCAALSSPNGQTSGAQYAAWFDQYVAPKYCGNLDGQTCYQFRCSLIHQGTTQHPGSQYSRIIFMEPSGHIFHNNVINGALNIDVRIFCRDVTASATSWITANQNTATYRQNYPRFIQRYPNGIPPYIVGAPVIG